ncbi:TetR/AcrR family transcriptional regulator C-terminal domain-containing protein [Dyella sedimenti]|uniref:TetR/AcrR family transcriptional regulator C-terminal domain-containing protein n=1 Tax=Dyella sedimenti TaxID=2919947 RepID=UPI001FA9E3CF|nr:TetR/AcrR family transcriptional regulator C-terminal domain-containing protein [Dyella sedimenti]
MKVNRELIVRTALQLLDDIGLEELTLRKLAARLGIQAPTLYWHFSSKQALIDDMATTILVEASGDLAPARPGDDWTAWVMAFGQGIRRRLLQYRDGGRVVAGSRLTNALFHEAAERIGAQLLEAGLSHRQAIVLMSTVYTFTIGFVVEEQAVFPRPGERSPAYDIAQRNQALDAGKFPLMRKAGPVLFDQFDRRYRESVKLVIEGARASASR